MINQEIQSIPKIIAHRGFSGIFPENTLEGFLSAAYLGADFIELDVQLTRDKILVVSHKPILSELTNIKEKQQFSDRKSTNSFQFIGNNINDWWIFDFTIEELKQLQIKQILSEQRLKQFDNLFTFPTLEEVLIEIIKFNEKFKGSRNLNKNLVGIAIEAKDVEIYRELWGIEQGEEILNLLKKYNLHTQIQANLRCPIYLYSFEIETVQIWSKSTDLLNGMLGVLDKEGNFKFSLKNISLAMIATFAKIININISGLYDNHKQQSTGFVEKSKQLGLLVHGSVFRDDQTVVFGNDQIEQYLIAHNILQLDGVITEFPSEASSILQMNFKLNNNLLQQGINKNRLQQ